MDKIITVITSNGPSYIDMDTKTIAWLMANGFGEHVDGEYILHRINYECMIESEPNTERIMRFAKAPYAMGFKKYCDVHEWGLAKDLIGDAVTGGYLTSDDATFINDLLPS